MIFISSHWDCNMLYLGCFGRLFQNLFILKCSSLCVKSMNCFSRVTLLLMLLSCSLVDSYCSEYQLLSKKYFVGALIAFGATCCTACRTYFLWMHPESSQSSFHETKRAGTRKHSFHLIESVLSKVMMASFLLAF